MKLLIGHLIVILTFGEVFGQKTERVKLIEFSQSACDRDSDPYRIKPRIISFGHAKNILTIEIGFAGTCCLDYVPSIKYSADTLYMSYTTTGDACFCACCYSFIHKIKGINSSNLTVKLDNKVIELSGEKYLTYAPTFVIVSGDTLNRKDKYGLKQGIWIHEAAILKIESDTATQKNYGLEQVDRANRAVSFYRYEDDKSYNWGHLYLNLKIKDEYNSKTKVHQEFYNNGKIKSECHETVNGKSTGCRQWERNGQEIK